jgi:hypothetical protein
MEYLMQTIPNGTKVLIDTDKGVYKGVVDTPREFYKIIHKEDYYDKRIQP